jgi:hypothetical protein
MAAGAYAKPQLRAMNAALKIFIPAIPCISRKKCLRRREISEMFKNFFKFPNHLKFWPPDEFFSAPRARTTRLPNALQALWNKHVLLSTYIS